MSDSMKHRNFMDFALEIQNVNVVPGIGPAYAANLATNGYTQASQLYMLLLECNGNQQQFVTKLQELTGGGSPNNMILAYNALMEWHRQRGNMS